MSKLYSQTSSTNETTEWLRVDSKGISGNNFLIVVDMEAGGGSALACVDVQFTIDKDLSSASPIQHHILLDVQESTASTLHIPIQGIRMKVLGHKKGTVKLTVQQY